jgi:hypothetical protein
LIGALAAQLRIMHAVMTVTELKLVWLEISIASFISLQKIRRFRAVITTVSKYSEIPGKFFLSRSGEMI